MARHRLEVSGIWVVLLFVVGSATGAVFAWFVGRVADTAYDRATDPGSLAVDHSDTLFSDSVVPPGAEKSLADTDGGMIQSARIVQDVGGAPVGPVLQVVVSGLEDSPLILNSISAADVKCVAAARDWPRDHDDIGGALPGLHVDLSLEEQDSTAQGSPIFDSGNPDVEEWEFPRQVSRSEADRFFLHVSAPPEKVCSFKVRFGYRVNGESGLHLFDRGLSVAGADVGVNNVRDSWLNVE